MIAVVEPRAADKVAAVLKREGERVMKLGETVATQNTRSRVSYVGRLDL
jgi:phosphoribosylaminoimidazole (AIR) synthetase